MMTKLEHRGYGSLGDEFIVHHNALHPKRLIFSLVVTTALSAAFKLYEMDTVMLWIISMLLAVIVIFRLANKVSREVLLVLPSLGVQVKTQYWLGGLETRFFDRSTVKGIVITEAITMHSVLSYLAVLLTSSGGGQVDQVYPLFTKSWPCLKDLVYVYRKVGNMNTGAGLRSGVLISASPKTRQQSGSGDTPCELSPHSICKEPQTANSFQRKTRSSKS